MAETGASPLPQTPPAHSPLFRAEHFVWLTARVLEQRLFAYHFLNGGPDPVETALDAYRNEDGGYGHALEPDLRGPVSQPLHTAHALRVLDAVGRCGGQRVERVCRYLTSVSTADGALPGGHSRASAAIRRPPSCRSWTTRRASSSPPGPWWVCCTATRCGTPGCSGPRTSAGRRWSPWSVPSVRDPGRRGLPGLRARPPARGGGRRPSGPPGARAAARRAGPREPRRVPRLPRLRPGRAPLPARLREDAGLPRARVVHGRRDGPFAGLPRRPSSGRTAAGRSAGASGPRAPPWKHAPS